jgi:hypothetical protein
MLARGNTRSVITATLGVIALVLYCAAIWWDWLPWLRGWLTYPEGWSWASVRRAPPLSRYLAPLLCVGLGALLIWGFQRRVERRRGWSVGLALAALVLCGYVWQLGLLGLKSETPSQLLVSRMSDENFTGYFTAAQRVPEFRSFFRDWRSVLQLCGHCPTHPVGSTMYFWLLFQGVNGLPADLQQSLATSLRSALGFRGQLSPGQTLTALVGGNLMLLLAALSVVPLYLLGRRLAGRKTALLIAGLGVVLPGLALMSPELDQAYALISGSTLVLAVFGLETRRGGVRVISGASAGLLMALGLFFTFGLVVWVLVLAGIAGAYVLGIPLSSAETGPGSAMDRARRAVIWGGALLLGLALPYLALAPAGYNLLEVAATALGTHRAFEAERPGSSIWLVFGPLDFLQFVGLPVALCTLLCLGWMVRAGQVGLRSINVYAWIFWGLIVVLFGSGNLKAETSRTLIFFMPLALAALALAAGRTGHLPAHRLRLLLAAQVLICLIMGSRWFTP